MGEAVHHVAVVATLSGMSERSGTPERHGQERRGGSRRARQPAQDPAARLAAPLRKVLERLPETQRRVLELRMGLADGHPHDLADTARTLGISMSEARDIETRAFAHIRETVPLEQLQRLLPR